MVKGCTNNCMKLILFVFNFIFVAIGAALLSLGIYVIVKSSNLKEIVETPDAAAIIVIVIGAVTFFIAFLGCCGAGQENSCMLTTYAVIVGIVFLVETAVAIVLLVYTRQLTEYARDGVEEAIRKYEPGNPNNPINEMVDLMQFNLQCCGAAGKDDWMSTAVGLTKSYPRSCCFDPTKLDAGGTCGYLPGATAPFKKPCSEALDDFLRLFSSLLAAILIVAAVIKIMAACFACSLRNAFDA